MKKLLAALAVAGLAATGCGASSSGGAADAAPPASGPTQPPPAGSPSPDPLTTRSVPPITNPRALRTTPVDLASGKKLVSIPWQFVALSNSGKTINIQVQYGGCTAFDYVEVQQTSSSVEITAWGSRSTDTHVMCPAFVALLRGTVTLDAPLGSRQLLHAPISGLDTSSLGTVQ
jgi:hypothetical protein